MKGILEFSLPEETREFAVASNAGEIATAVADFREWLRQNRKHGDTIMVSWDDVWDRLHAELEGLGEIVWG